MPAIPINTLIPEVHGEEFADVVAGLYNQGGILTEQEAKEIAEEKIRHAIKDWFIQWRCHEANKATRATAISEINIL